MVVFHVSTFILQLHSAGGFPDTKNLAHLLYDSRYAKSSLFYNYFFVVNYSPDTLISAPLSERSSLHFSANCLPAGMGSYTSRPTAVFLSLPIS